MTFRETEFVQASHKSVLVHFRQVASRFPGSWIASTNPFMGDAAEEYKRQTEAGAVDQVSLGEYIAASIVSHAFDGWTYLGRALAAHLAGDGGSAAHLAYYAEFRAANSLLAAHGIGILDRQHAILRADGTVIPSKGQGSHAYVWEALNRFSKLSNPEVALVGLRPGGIGFLDWLDALGIKATKRKFAQDWLTAWGLDLGRLAPSPTAGPRVVGVDQAARELASYRPSALPPRPPLSARQCGEATHAVWEACQPTSSSPFFRLDRHLLRLTIETEYQLTLKEQGTTKEELVSKVLTKLNPQDPADNEVWLRFLLRQEEPLDLPIITLAQGKSAAGSGSHHPEAIARATLLLRLASGVSAALLSSEGVKLSELEFWVRPLLQGRALWEDDELPASLADLWEDVKEPIASMHKFCGNAGSTEDLRFLHRLQWDSMGMLCELERPGLWGLGI